MRRMKVGWGAAMLILGMGIGVAPAGFSETLPVYIGTYTGKGSQGIYLYELDSGSGHLRQVMLAAETVNPSFLALAPGGDHLYAVNEIGKFEGADSGSVTSYAIQADGSLQELNRVASGGGGPCHLVVDDDGRRVLVANYGGGSVAVLPILDGGRLGDASDVEEHQGSSVNPQRQKEPHAHSVNLDAGNRHAVVADLGLDQLLVYQFHSGEGQLELRGHFKTAPGAGPRHFAFHPNGEWAYVLNELNSTLQALRYDGMAGTFEELDTASTLPGGWDGRNSTAEVQVHPSGRFVYASNRGHDSIAIFAVEEKSGRLSLLENQSTRGRTPRNFGIDPSGSFLIAANQNNDSLSVFRIQPERGLLEPVGEPVTAPSPVCVRFKPVQ